MKKLNFIKFGLLILILSLGITLTDATASSGLYGSLDIAVSRNNIAAKSSVTDIANHASLIGIEGDKIFDNGISAIYKYEWQVDPIDRDPTFIQRNSYVGLKSAFGEVIIGKHDTPVKQSQGSIDLFNDTAGDIRNILWGENRSKKIVQWTSPKANGFTVSTMLVLEKGEEALSTNLIWRGRIGGNKANFSIGFDFEVPQNGYVFDTKRVAAAIPLGRHATLGVIWQESENTTGRYNDDGYVVSLKMEMSNKATFKVMHGESGMVKVGGELTGVGFDYKIAKPLKLYLNYIDKSYADLSEESEHIMAGFQYKFSLDMF